MYVCFLCGDYVKFQTPDKLHFHLLRHKDNCELKIPIRCRQERCVSTYTTVFNFIRHLHTHYSLTTAISEQDSVACSSTSDVMPVDVDVSCMGNDVTDEEDTAANCLQDMETEVVSLVAGLRANSSVPYSVVPAVVESFSNMTACMISLVQSSRQAD